MEHQDLVVTLVFLVILDQEFQATLVILVLALAVGLASAATLAIAVFLAGQVRLRRQSASQPPQQHRFTRFWWLERAVVRQHTPTRICLTTLRQTHS